MQDETTTRRRAWIALAVLVAVNAALHLLALRAGPYLDEGCFASSGLWLSRGDLFYVDTWNERGPLFYLVTALVYLFAPATLESVRILGLAFSCAQMILLYALARRFAKPNVALLAPLVYLAGHPFFLGLFYLTEPFEGVLILAGLLFVSRDYPAPGPRPARAAMAGLCFSLLAMDKQSGIVLFALVGAWIAWRATRRAERFTELPAYLAAAASPWAVLFGVYAAYGELDTLIWGLTFLLTEYGVSDYSRVPGVTEWLLAAPWILLAIGGLVLALLRRGDRGTMFVAWLAGTLVLMAPSFFLYHTLLLLLPAGAGAAWLAESALAAKRRGALAIGVAVIAGVTGFAVWRGAGLVQWFYEPNRWTEVETIAREIRENTEPGDTIWVFPHESTIYLFADRHSASRFPFLLPWTASGRVVAEIASDLRTRKPKYVVYTQHYRDTSGGVSPSEFADIVIREISSRYRVAGMTRSGLVLLERETGAQPLRPAERENTDRVLRSEELPQGGGIRILAPFHR